MKKFLIWSLIFSSVILVPQAAFSAALMPEGEEDLDYSYGTVIDIKNDSNEIILTEYDWESDKDIEITYSISPDVRVENSSSWQSIPIGSDVDVEYVTDENDNRIAMSITLWAEGDINE